VIVVPVVWWPAKTITATAAINQRILSHRLPARLSLHIQVPDKIPSRVAPSGLVLFNQLGAGILLLTPIP